MTRRLCLSLLFASTASLLLGCDDECQRGKSECLSDNVIRTCVAGEDDNIWFVHECAQSERCTDDAQQPAEGDAGPSGSGALCEGTCDVGQSECVSPALARYCVNGTQWALDACQVGERCVDGTCQVGVDGGVRACVPGTRTCGSELVLKVCDAEGSAWIAQPCGTNEICMGDSCVPDPRSSCDDGNRCIDNRTAIRCLGRGEGFELVECQDQTWCQGARCVGPNCAVGDSCVGLNQVRRCSDGVNFVDMQCGANEICQQDGDHAGCVPRVCTPGTTVCGDPEDPDADPTLVYSQCIVGPNSGVPQWLRGTCEGNLLCDPASTFSNNPCRQACTPGAETCAADATSGVHDGYRVCQEDGTWGAVNNCNGSGATRMQCALRPNLLASDLPTHVCAEPACAYLFNNVGFGGGVCEQAELNACDAEGHLGEAAPCDSGFCRSLTGVGPQSDGRVPGQCDATARCQEGEERCIDDGLNPTPLYQTCDNGEWSSAFSTCAGDDPCLDWIDAEGMSRKLCGAVCVPGRHQCNDAQALQTCGDNGQWGTAIACTLGRCQATSSNDAACVLDCVPGETLCTGTEVLSSDNASVGTTAQITCAADGTLSGTPVDCAAGQTCRVTSIGVSLGCVECLGPNAPGGNASGLVDSRCAPGGGDSIQICGADNRWQASRTCAAGRTCVGASGPTCGTCTSITGNPVVCTEENISDIEVCGSCQVAADDAGTLITVGACTQSAIQTIDPSASCGGMFGGGPTSWGGYADCCDGDAGAYLQTTNVQCSTLGYGVASAWGGEPDCCSAYQLPAGGPAFAYCSE